MVPFVALPPIYVQSLLVVSNAEHPETLTQLTGTGAIVISPTRELSLQTYGVVRDLCKFHMQVNEHIVREHKSVVCIQHTRLLHPQYGCFDLSTPV